MSVNVVSEHPLSLAAVSKLLPPGRNGKHPTFGCVLRWITTGAPGPNGEPVRLRAGRVGGRWFSSTEAVNEFIAALTPPPSSPSSTRSARQRRTASERAEQVLAADGI
jgi:hypothetical protein